ncbi:3-methylfumaryl-CoA hydratase [Cryobacterium flavum]|uniref:3-methylfumaryl-CoA hydratase n=1 Tax=Cryobacterium flavum TaxID=1424659 RepID=A0A4R8UZC6_9MICO|nr:MaoC family dehydratase N-terminal domain-containing protein [Cryobacterium flavum]TFB73621.1 hypothetical protein E3O21_17120 [Cryobacterium flavum]SDO32393.1 3-methylfumaryl-CoA hydratase [Cryobacterium flavum]
MQELSSYLADWHPDAQVMTRTASADAVNRFAALLDVESPGSSSGDALPPLWHSFFFTEVHAQADLGPDGHPRDGHFLPPIPDRKRMFAGGRFEQQSPIRLGTEYTRRSTLAKTEEKSGRSGPSLFVTVRHQYFDGVDLVATEEEDIVYRRQTPGEIRPPAPTQDTRADPRADMRTTIVNETFLFRFSALTNNAHRIHYDHPYATDVEGFPGLVVHGPLLGLLALEVPRHELPPSLLQRYTYRLTRPAFVGPDIEACATREDAVWHLEAGSTGKATSITAQAVFRKM